MYGSSRNFTTVSTQLVSACRRNAWDAHGVAFVHTTRRSLHAKHERRDLPYPIENGVGDFLPPQALKTVVEWQDGLFQRLNEQVRGTNLAKKPTVLQIIVDSAGDPNHIRAFNYACLAANNSFFLASLKPPGEMSNEVDISENLRLCLLSQFRDMNALKEQFVASASGMVSSGWLWLVTDGYGNLAVIPTFGAGTLFRRRKDGWKAVKQDTLIRQPVQWQMEPLESDYPPPGPFPQSQGGPTPTSPVSGTSTVPPNINPHTPARSMHFSSAIRYQPSVLDRDTIAGDNSDAKARIAYKLGSVLYPLCCLSLFEHTWLSAGLGVWGKEEYVRRFFDVIDWKRISDIFDRFRGSGNV